MASEADYDAFISYSHGQDKTLGPQLQSVLQRFAKPWYRLRALRVFCDTANLAASPGLWASIEEALRGSRWFLLLASADAARSDAVNREVEWWLAHRSSDRLLIASTSPGLVWDKERQDWATGAPVPPALRGAFSSEPFWVDLSGIRLDARRPVLPPERIAALAAPLRGVPQDALIGEHLREHRRAWWLARAAIALLTALLVAVSVATVVAIAQRDTAIAQRDQAISGQLAVESESVGGTNLQLSAAESVAAWRIDPTDQARYAMLSAAEHPGFTVVNGVNALAFSPNGKVLATGTENANGSNDFNAAQLWDVTTRGKIGKPFTGDTDTVVAVAFSPDGRILATGSDDDTARLWNVTTHEQIGTPLRVPGFWVTSVAFSPDGKILATGSADGTVRLWSVATHRQIGHPIEVPNSALGPTFAFSPDGKTIAVGGGEDGSVRLWDVAAEAPVGKPFAGQAEDFINSVAFSPDGKTLATGDSNGYATLWNVTTHEQIGTLNPSFLSVDSVAFSPDGRTLATGGTYGTVLWNVSTRQEIGSPLTDGSNTDVSRLQFSPDGETLATFGAQLELWNLTSEIPQATMTAGTSPVDSLEFSPDGRFLATATQSGEVQLWDLRRRTVIGTLTSHGVAIDAVAFSPDSKTLALATIRGTIALWSMADPKQVKILFTGLGASAGGGQVVFSPDGRSDALAFSGNGKILASSNIADQVRLWNVGTGHQIGILPAGNPGNISSLAFSPNGSLLAGGDASNGTVTLWNVASREPVAGKFTGGTAGDDWVEFMPAGNELVAANIDGTVYFWNTATHRQIGDPLTHYVAVNSASLSPDGETLVSASADGALRLWDTATHEEIGEPLANDSSGVDSVAFSPDGNVVAAGSNDGIVRLWNVTFLYHALSQLCAEAGQSFTPAEWQQYVPPGPSYENICP
jgi:WD40 repeat protein